jgi:hypothetical protein
MPIAQRIGNEVMRRAAEGFVRKGHRGS